MPCCYDDNCPVEDLREEMIDLLKDMKDILITIIHSDAEHVDLNSAALLQKLSERIDKDDS